jgi:hypothetical protein
MRAFRRQGQPREPGVRRPIVRSAWKLFVLVLAPAVFLFMAAFDGEESTSSVRHATWYCADDGHGPPRHLEQPRIGLHRCTDDELHDACYWSGVV